MFFFSFGKKCFHYNNLFIFDVCIIIFDATNFCVNNFTLIQLYANQMIAIFISNLKTNYESFLELGKTNLYHYCLNRKNLKVLNCRYKYKKYRNYLASTIWKYW